MKLEKIDNGKDFDWGKTSKDYALYRDIYPESFYNKLHSFGIGVKGQKILDLGTGTGVIPRNMYKFGADFIGSDISEQQINHANELSKKLGMKIEWNVCPTENIKYPDNYFDAITACQCWQYFNYTVVIPEIIRMLKPGGYLAILFMAWLPYEDDVAKASENVVLSYNPDWKGAGMKRNELSVPEHLKESFTVTTLHTYDENLTFTKEAWAGRMRACRGIGATLSSKKVNEFDKEHRNLLSSIEDEKLSILHQITYRIFRVKK